MTRRAMTLLEVLAGLVVLGLIVGVGVRVLPELLARNAAGQAEAVLERAALAQMSHAGRHGFFTDDPEVLPSLPTGRGLELTTGPSTGIGVVSTHVAEDGSLLLAVRDNQGLCHGRLIDDPLVDADVVDIEPVALSSCNALSLRDPL